MSAFALSGIAVALKKLNTAIENIENYCEHDDAANEARLIGDAFSALLTARGQLTAVQQLIALEDLLTEAKTAAPLLTVVK